MKAIVFAVRSLRPHQRLSGPSPSIVSNWSEFQTRLEESLRWFSPSLIGFFFLSQILVDGWLLQVLLLAVLLLRVKFTQQSFVSIVFVSILFSLLALTVRFNILFTHSLS
jgi:hypothetical protein